MAASTRSISITSTRSPIGAGRECFTRTKPGTASGRSPMAGTPAISGLARTTRTAANMFRTGFGTPMHGDKQLGTVPLMLTLVSLDPSLQVPGVIAPAADKPVPPPAAVPQGHDGTRRGELLAIRSLATRCGI